MNIAVAQGAIVALLLSGLPSYGQSAENASVSRDCEQCPEIVSVPTGKFLMGSVASKENRFLWGGGQVLVKVEPFFIGRKEVSFAEWDACVDAGGCSHKPQDTWGRGEMPVIRVSWNDAQEYLAWLSNITGFNYRLPNEAEWEYAARAGTETARYWGDEIGNGLAACKGCGSEWERTGTAPVGSFDPNPFGLYDMLGNVYEWVADCWNDRHEGAPVIATARESGDCAYKVAKSGSFGTDHNVVVSAFRKNEIQDSRLISLGFRVARDDG